VRQAIKTKYLAPTACRGARVRATCGDGSITLTWDYRLDTLQNHVLTARALLVRLGWSDRHLVGGALGDEYVWVDNGPAKKGGAG
jgi:hypothetical protein